MFANGINYIQAAQLSLTWEDLNTCVHILRSQTQPEDGGLNIKDGGDGVKMANSGGFAALGYQGPECKFQKFSETLSAGLVRHVLKAKF